MAGIMEKSGTIFKPIISRGTYKKIDDSWVETDFNELDLKNYVVKTLMLPDIVYISLGDSIAAGHAINDAWYADYTMSSQYGSGNNKQTAIVPGCYTDLIGKDLRANNRNNVFVKSFGRSADRVIDLMNKLDKPEVISALKKATHVSLCVISNDTLMPMIMNIADYITIGDAALDKLIDDVYASLATLDDDTQPYSYTALLNKLKSINPDAKYVFTTVYSPYKYCYLDDGADGFFKPLLDLIPRIYIDVDELIEWYYGIDELQYWDITSWQWKPIELGMYLDEYLTEKFLQSDMVRQLYDRIDNVAELSDRFVGEMNRIITEKITAFNNPNFTYVDAKAAFDLYPDRTVSAPVHYNDLLNVQFTRGFDTAQMDWSALWREKYGETVEGATKYWRDLFFKHLKLVNASPSLNVFDYMDFDVEEYAKDLILQIVEKVIWRDIDPHPTHLGHQLFHQLFSNAFGESSNVSTRTITFEAGEHASGTMQPVKTIIFDNNNPTIVIPKCSFTPDTTNGYHFTHWIGSDGKTYSDGDTITLENDITLIAQWSNIYAITYMHTNHTLIFGNDETGHQECYELWINGELMPKFDTFASGSSTTYYLPYGTPIGVYCESYVPNEISYNKADCRVYLNDEEVAVGHGETGYDLPNGITKNMIIDFRWKVAGSIIPTFNAQSWEDCYITTY